MTLIVIIPWCTTKALRVRLFIVNTQVSIQIVSQLCSPRMLRRTGFIPNLVRIYLKEFNSFSNYSPRSQPTGNWRRITHLLSPNTKMTNSLAGDVLGSTLYFILLQSAPPECRRCRSCFSLRLKISLFRLVLSKFSSISQYYSSVRRDRFDFVYRRHFLSWPSGLIRFNTESAVLSLY